MIVPASFIWQILGLAAIALGCEIILLVIKRVFRLRRQNRLPPPGKMRRGVEFERELKVLFEAEGWKAEITPRYGDFGADLLLSKDGRRVVVQAKNWNGPVGIRAVQEVAGARDHYLANEAWVICTSSFTKAAIDQAKSSQVRLRDANWLQSKK